MGATLLIYEKNLSFFEKALYKFIFMVYYIEKWLKVARSGKKWVKIRDTWNFFIVTHFPREIKAQKAKPKKRKNCTQQQTGGNSTPVRKT